MSFGRKPEAKDMEFVPTKRSSYKERKENALASGADEGRDKLRKASGRSKYPVIRRYPNGATRCGNTAATCIE
jgi:hypothetical protein